MALFGQEKVDNVYKDYFDYVYNEMLKLNEYMKKNGVQTTVFSPGQLARVKYASECDKIDPRAILAIKAQVTNMVKYANEHLYVPEPDQNIILMYMIDNKNFMRGGNFKNDVDRGYVEKLKAAINQFLPNPEHIKQKAKINTNPDVIDKMLSAKGKRKPVSNDNEDRSQNDNQRYRKGLTYTFKSKDRFVEPNKETLEALLLFLEAERELYTMGVGGVEHVDNQNPTQNYGDRLIVKTIEVIEAYKNAPCIKVENDLSIRQKALENVERIKSYLGKGSHLDALYAAFNDARKRGAMKGIVTKAIGRGQAALAVLTEKGIKLEDVLLESTPIDEALRKKVEKMR